MEVREVVENNSQAYRRGLVGLLILSLVLNTHGLHRGLEPIIRQSVNQSHRKKIKGNNMFEIVVTAIITPKAGKLAQKVRDAYTATVAPYAH